MKIAYVVLAVLIVAFVSVQYYNNSVEVVVGVEDNCIDFNGRDYLLKGGSQKLNMTSKEVMEMIMTSDNFCRNK